MIHTHRESSVPCAWENILEENSRASVGALGIGSGTYTGDVHMYIHTLS